MVPLLTSLLRVAVVLLGGWVILQWPRSGTLLAILFGGCLHYAFGIDAGCALCFSTPEGDPAGCFPVEKAAGVGYGRTVFNAVPPYSLILRAPGSYR